MAQITGESIIHPAAIASLDGSLFVLREHEQEFLHTALTLDDEELKERILQVQRDQKFEYPCIYAFHFVTLYMDTNPVYPEVVASGKVGNTLFLDLGCCMGTDVRKLVFDGYPASKVLGCDLRRGFIDLGYKLYRDNDKCSIRFFSSDIFEVPYPFPQDEIPVAAGVANVNNLVSQLCGKITHFYIGALFHLFDESTQYALALRVAITLKRVPGAIIFGRHQGLPEPGSFDDYQVVDEKKRFGHSPSSWAAMWKSVFAEVESPDFAENNVIATAKLVPDWDRNHILTKKGSCMLFWCVKIV